MHFNGLMLRCVFMCKINFLGSFWKYLSQRVHLMFLGAWVIKWWRFNLSLWPKLFPQMGHITEGLAEWTSQSQVWSLPKTCQLCDKRQCLGFKKKFVEVHISLVWNYKHVSDDSKVSGRPRESKSLLLRKGQNCCVIDLPWRQSSLYLPSMSKITMD